jgi:hypothetical protein
MIAQRIPLLPDAGADILEAKRMTLAAFPRSRLIGQAELKELILDIPVSW